MLSLVGILALGFLLGMRHATDADHVVAVSAIVSRQGTVTGAGAVGVLWGLGHTITVFAVGVAIIVFKLAITPRLGLAFELAVALMLVLLGALNLAGLPARGADSGVSERPFFVGVVHGLAGSAFVALAVQTRIDDPGRAVAYLLVFGVGTLVGMMLITALIAVPLRYAAARYLTVNRYLTLASGAASVAFGLFLVHHIGVVDGLFSDRPMWAPR